jgi:hypothetical protein
MTRRADGIRGSSQEDWTPLQSGLPPARLIVHSKNAVAPMMRIAESISWVPGMAANAPLSADAKSSTRVLRVAWRSQFVLLRASMRHIATKNYSARVLFRLSTGQSIRPLGFPGD